MVHLQKLLLKGLCLDTETTTFRLVLTSVSPLAKMPAVGPPISLASRPQLHLAMMRALWWPWSARCMLMFRLHEY